MDREISVWDMARGLLIACTAEDDLRTVARALQNPRTRGELIRVLLALRSTLEPLTSTTPKASLRTEGSNKPEAVLRTLFRTRLKMTNKEVESWLSTSLGVSRRIGKESLESYLQAVLDAGLPGFERTILSQASRDFMSKLSSSQELRTFWDNLDSWSKGGVNAAVRGGTRELPAESQEPGSIREQ